jgi:hypothetical protein
MNLPNIIKQEYSNLLLENNTNDINKVIDSIIFKASKIKLSSFIKSFNMMMKKENYISMYIDDYEGDISRINSAVASRFLNELSNKIGNGYNEVEFRNQSKKPDNHFQMMLYGIVGIYSSPFVYVNNKHMVVEENTKIELLDLRDDKDNYFETLLKVK